MSPRALIIELKSVVMMTPWDQTLATTSLVSCAHSFNAIQQLTFLFFSFAIIYFQFTYCSAPESLRMRSDLVDDISLNSQNGGKFHCIKSKLVLLSQHRYPNHDGSGIKCINVCLQFQNYNSKYDNISKGVIVRGFATGHLFKMDGLCSHVSLSALVPLKFQRSRNLHDPSSIPSNGVNDFERHLQELFDEVKNANKKGNKEDALDLLQANFEVVKEQINEGSQGIGEAAILDVIALGYITVGDLKMVASLLDMLNKIVLGLRNEEPLLDSILLHMGSMYSFFGKFEESMLMYHRALSAMETIYGESSIFLVTPLLGLAKIDGFTGKTTKAIDRYNRAIKIIESNRGSMFLDLVIPLFGLGNLLIKEGRAADAENPFIRILDIHTKLFGENDGRTGMAMSSLAHAKCAQGKVHDAISLYKSALKIIKDSEFIDLDDYIMERMRIDLAELLHVVGRGDEGRKLLEECMRITEKYKGVNHPSIATHLINLATSYLRSKNYAEAEHLLRRSLQIMTRHVGPDDQSLTFPKLHLAIALYNLRRDEEAEELSLEVLRVREKSFGEESLPVGEALDCLVCIQVRLGRDGKELLKALKRVLRIQEKEFGNESREVMETLKKMLLFVKKEDKFPLQRRLSLLTKKYKQMVN